MKVRCVTNNILSLPKEQQEFAYGQDEQGITELTIGKEYISYGVRTDKLGQSYLVLSDDLHSELPWWMPAGLFSVSDARQPKSWRELEIKGDEFGPEKLLADPEYFEVAEEIEDKTKKGRRAFDGFRAKSEIA